MFMGFVFRLLKGIINWIILLALCESFGAKRWDDGTKLPAQTRTTRLTICAGRFFQALNISGNRFRQELARNRMGVRRKMGNWQ